MCWGDGHDLEVYPCICSSIQEPSPGENSLHWPENLYWVLSLCSYNVESGISTFRL